RDDDHRRAPRPQPRRPLLSSRRDRRRWSHRRRRPRGPGPVGRPNPRRLRGRSVDPADRAVDAGHPRTSTRLIRAAWAEVSAAVTFLTRLRVARNPGGMGARMSDATSGGAAFGLVGAVLGAA